METLKSSYLLLFLLASTVFSDSVEEANEYMDLLLGNLRNDPVIAKKVEPIHVPNVRENTFEGRNIYIQGLSDLYRLEDSYVEAKEDKTYVTSKLGVAKIRFTMDYKAKQPLLPLWISGKAEGKIDHVIVHCVVGVSSLDGTGKVEEFIVTDFGRFAVTKVRGATIAFNWLATIIANVMFNHSKGMLIEGIEKGVSKLLQEKLSEVKITSRKLNSDK
ncbi:uncharacterized protein [Centruroides vittatus]|uniref:uncharacterized protein n=1 Tax=Centruroides vittatus TaxID=120091 RepID=UPI00350FCF5C